MGREAYVLIVELLDLERAWMSQANCKGMDPELFFPDRGDAWTVRAAKATCDACNVEVQCLEYALTHRERYGIYGGKSERQRRQILCDRRKQIA